MITKIIKVLVSVISLSLWLRLITLTSTLIILDITKTLSNNNIVYNTVDYFLPHQKPVFIELFGSGADRLHPQGLLVFLLSFANFSPPFQLVPTNCPWASEDGPSVDHRPEI